MQCKTCPFYNSELRIRNYAEDCAIELLKDSKIPHPCLAVRDALEPVRIDEPVCFGHQEWINKKCLQKIVFTHNAN